MKSLRQNFRPLPPHRLALIFCFVPLFMLVNGLSRAQSPEGETDSLYLGNRVMLTTSEPLQLTLNARIVDFAWSPDGKRIAYWSQSHTGNDSCIAVTRSDGGPQRIYFQGHSASSEGDGHASASSVMSLGGWSSDGNAFAFVVGTQDPATRRGGPSVIVADASTGALQAVPMPAGEDAGQVRNVSALSWSPEQNLLVFAADTVGADSLFATHIIVYDPETGASRGLLPSMAYAILGGWQDGIHLQMLARPRDGKFQHLLVDVLTGETAPVTTKPAFAAYHPAQVTRRLDAGAAGIVTLSLLSRPDSVSVDSFTDASAIDLRGKRHREAVNLWVSVARDSPQATAWLPGSVAQPGKAPDAKPTAPPQILVDSYRYRRSDMLLFPISFAPSQRGTAARAQVAYLISGDLYVSTISVRAPSVQELIAAGETLTCPEERHLAEDYSRQIGLAITQYVQDYDDTLPMAGNFHDEINGYVRGASVFQVGHQTFHYVPDGGAVNDLGTPSEAELGYFDLPCGRVVLYADGHVQVLEKQQANPRVPGNANDL